MSRNAELAKPLARTLRHAQGTKQYKMAVPVGEPAEPAEAIGWHGHFGLCSVIYLIAW